MSASPAPFRPFRVLDDSSHALVKDGKPVSPGDEPPGLDDELFDGLEADALEGRILGYTLVEADELRRRGGATYDVEGVGLVVVAPHPSTGELWGVALVSRTSTQAPPAPATQGVAEESIDR